jgi:hypothetical protein
MGTIQFAVNKYLKTALGSVNGIIEHLTHQEPPSVADNPNVLKALSHLYWLQGYLEGEIK